MDYKQRRRKLLDELGSDKAVVAVSAALEVQQASISLHDYSQDSNFRYLCGYKYPDAVLIFNSDESLLFVRPADEHELLWERTEIDFDSIKKQTLVDDVRPLDQLDSWLKSHRSNQFYVPFIQIQEYSRAQPNRATKDLLQKLKDTGINDVADANEALAVLRRVKDDTEIDLIEQATALSRRALDRLDLSVDYEYELEAQLTYEFRRQNANHAYSPIVASGSNVTVLHYRDNDAKLPLNGMILIDVGAEIEGYRADLTRMLEIGQAPKEQLQLLELTKQLQQRAIERVKPGVSVVDLSREFRQDLLEIAIKHGYLNKNSTLKDTLQIMPHGIGHYLGLEVHDAGDYNQPLEAGVVLMVEPGMYLFNKSIGVRIEDAVVVTDYGCRVLAEPIQ